MKLSLKWCNGGRFLLTLGHYVAQKSVFPQVDADADEGERES